MTLFDLLFLVLACAALASLLGAAGAALGGHRATAGRILRRLGIAAGAYLVVVYAVAVASPGRVLALGADACSDDWCIAVTDARPLPAAAGSGYEVTFRLSSRARRVSQRERGVQVWLRDAAGRRYTAERGAGEPPFDVELGPGETVLTRRRFALPAGARPSGIVLGRSGFPFPGCLIIGEATEVLHPTSVRLR